MKRGSVATGYCSPKKPEGIHTTEERVKGTF